MLFSRVSLLFSQLTLALAACDRSTLQQTFDNWVQSAISQSNGTSTAQISYSSSTKITQNNILLPTVAQTAYNNITGFYKPFRITAINTDWCEIASFILVNQKNTATKAVEPALMSIRIRLDEKSKSIDRLEILNVLKGSHAFFVPQNFPNEAPAFWSTPQTGKKLDMNDLTRIANMYPSGIEAGDGAAIPTAEKCPRIENGVQTSSICNSGLNRFKQPVTDRRWTADSLTGVVLGSFYFDKPKKFGYDYGLFLNEYFKIDDGKLTAIQAVMKELKGIPFFDQWKWDPTHFGTANGSPTL